MVKMEAIILAGGLGTRLREAVPHLPKPLAPINGKPFLDLLLMHLSSFHWIQKIILAVGYKSSTIMEHYQQHTWKFSLEFSLEHTPLGTGGALKLALQQTHGENVLILNGDSYFDLNYTLFLQHHLKNQADLSIACRKMKDVSRYGSIELTSDFRIRKFNEKGNERREGWINGGAYLMKTHLTNRLPSESTFSLEKDVFQQLLSERIFGYPSDRLFIDIGTRESFFEAQHLLKEYTE
jgi:D-glycero-alpha-D-manno-heptose 1-phosphate guanylyltransferase